MMFFFQRTTHEASPRPSQTSLGAKNSTALWFSESPQQSTTFTSATVSWLLSIQLLTPSSEGCPTPLRPTCNSVTLCNTYLKTRQMSLPGAVLYVASSCNGTANWKVWQSVTNAVTFDLPSSGCKSHLVLTSATCPFPDAQGMKKSCCKNTRQRESERERGNRIVKYSVTL